jgi:hypothetical protein
MLGMQFSLFIGNIYSGRRCFISTGLKTGANREPAEAG